MSDITHAMKLPLEARRRAMIIAVAHVGNSLDHEQIREIISRWIVHGSLSDEDWTVVEDLANAVMDGAPT